MSERLDCGDSGCLSPESSRGGMRTNGGCQCEREEVARAHERMADAIREAPSYRQRGKFWTVAEERARIVAMLRRAERTARAFVGGTDDHVEQVRRMGAADALDEMADRISRGET